MHDLDGYGSGPSWPEGWKHYWTWYEYLIAIAMVACLFYWIYDSLKVERII